jgi:hypothetical protein
MKKRKIALFMALCILLSAFSTVVYADEGTTLSNKSLDEFSDLLNDKATSVDEKIGNGEADVSVPNDEDIFVDTVGINTASGACGYDLLWTLDNGTLTISGNGEMLNGSNASWHSYKNQVHTVVIENGVTNIDTHAFFSSKSLKL